MIIFLSREIRIRKMMKRSFADKEYIEFHDECWGVPAYDDK